MNLTYWQTFPAKHFPRTPLHRPVGADTVMGRGPHRRSDACYQLLLLVGLPVAGELPTTTRGRMWRQMEGPLESKPFREPEVQLTLGHGRDSLGKEGQSTAQRHGHERYQTDLLAQTLTAANTHWTPRALPREKCSREKAQGIQTSITGPPPPPFKNFLSSQANMHQPSRKKTR